MNSSPSLHSLLLVGTHRRAHRNDPGVAALGIYAFRREAASGGFTPLGVTETAQPGWLAIHPNGRFVYAVNEVRDEDQAGISAFSLDPSSGALTFLNRQALPPMPCHCAVDATGRYLLAATFGGGSVHVFALEPDGRIGPETDRHYHNGSSTHPVRQASPHAHAVAFDPHNRRVLVPDLGTDRVHAYAFSPETGRLVLEGLLALPPQSGPRHVAFMPDGRHAFLVNEMSATIAVLDIERGLEPVQQADLLPEDFVGLRSGAAILAHPSGRTLYVTTRSHGSSGMPKEPGLDSLVWFHIDPDSAHIAFGGRIPSGGGIPRDMTFEPGADSILVAHQCSGTVVRFTLDHSTGAPVLEGIALRAPVPVCLVFPN
jgi:6-phosphogluconolactonase